MMKKIFCCFIFLLTLLNATYGFCNAVDLPLKLTISKVADKNKSTIVEIKIINISEQYVAFDNRMFFEKYEDRVVPLSELRLYVDKGNGFEKMTYIGEPYSFKLSPANPNRFLFLGSNHLWGIIADIESQFNCNFPRGNYRIKAVFENRSRSWMYKYFNKETISQMHIDEPNIFDGLIESNILSIEIGGKAKSK
jgi:hypothetical protein